MARSLAAVTVPAPWGIGGRLARIVSLDASAQTLNDSLVSLYAVDSGSDGRGSQFREVADERIGLISPSLRVQQDVTRLLFADSRVDFATGKSSLFALAELRDRGKPGGAALALLLADPASKGDDGAALPLWTLRLSGSGMASLEPAGASVAGEGEWGGDVRVLSARVADGPHAAVLWADGSQGGQPRLTVVRPTEPQSLPAGGFLVRTYRLWDLAVGKEAGKEEEAWGDYAGDAGGAVLAPALMACELLAGDAEVLVAAGTFGLAAGGGAAGGPRRRAWALVSPSPTATAAEAKRGDMAGARDPGWVLPFPAVIVAESITSLALLSSPAPPAPALAVAEGVAVRLLVGRRDGSLCAFDSHAGPPESAGGDSRLRIRWLGSWALPPVPRGGPGAGAVSGIRPLDHRVCEGPRAGGAAEASALVALTQGYLSPAYPAPAGRARAEAPRQAPHPVTLLARLALVPAGEGRPAEPPVRLAASDCSQPLADVRRIMPWPARVPSLSVAPRVHPWTGPALSAPLLLLLARPAPVALSSADEDGLGWDGCSDTLLLAPLPGSRVAVVVGPDAAEADGPASDDADTVGLGAAPFPRPSPSSPSSSSSSSALSAGAPAGGAVAAALRARLAAGLRDLEESRSALAQRLLLHGRALARLRAAAASPAAVAAAGAPPLSFPVVVPLPLAVGPAARQADGRLLLVAPGLAWPAAPASSSSSFSSSHSSVSALPVQPLRLFVSHSAASGVWLFGLLVRAGAGRGGARDLQVRDLQVRVLPTGPGASSCLSSPPVALAQGGLALLTACVQLPAEGAAGAAAPQLARAFDVLLEGRAAAWAGETSAASSVAAAERAVVAAKVAAGGGACVDDDVDDSAAALLPLTPQPVAALCTVDVARVVVAARALRDACLDCCLAPEPIDDVAGAAASTGCVCASESIPLSGAGERVTCPSCQLPQGFRAPPMVPPAPAPPLQLEPAGMSVRAEVALRLRPRQSPASAGAKTSPAAAVGRAACARLVAAVRNALGAGSAAPGAERPSSWPVDVLPLSAYLSEAAALGAATTLQADVGPVPTAATSVLVARATLHVHVVDTERGAARIVFAVRAPDVAAGAELAEAVRHALLPWTRRPDSPLPAPLALCEEDFVADLEPSTLPSGVATEAAVAAGDGLLASLVGELGAALRFAAGAAADAPQPAHPGHGGTSAEKGAGSVDGVAAAASLLAYSARQSAREVRTDLAAAALEALAGWE